MDQSGSQLLFTKQGWYPDYLWELFLSVRTRRHNAKMTRHKNSYKM